MTVKRKFILLSERFAKRVPLVTLADTSTATSGRSARCGRLVDMEVELPTGNLLEETTDPIAESLFGANDDSDMIYLKSMDFQEVYLHCVKSEVEELRTFEADVLFPVRPYQERLRIFMDESWLEDANNMTVGDHVQIEFESHATRGIIKYKGLVPEKSPEGIMFGVELKGHKEEGNCDGSISGKRYFTCAPNSGLFVSALNIRSAGVSLGKHGSFDGQNFSDLLTHQSTTGSTSSKSKSSGKHSTSVATSNSFSEAKVSKSGPPLDINNRVVWISDIGPEYGYVRWIGNLPEVRDDWMVGVEFDNPVGVGTGNYKEHQLFLTQPLHAAIVPINGLMKADDFGEDSQKAKPFDDNDSGSSSRGHKNRIQKIDPSDVVYHEDAPSAMFVPHEDHPLSRSTCQENSTRVVPILRNPESRSVNTPARAMNHHSAACCSCQCSWLFSPIKPKPHPFFFFDPFCRDLLRCRCLMNCSFGNQKPGSSTCMSRDSLPYLPPAMHQSRSRDVDSRNLIMNHYTTYSPMASSATLPGYDSEKCNTCDENIRDNSSAMRPPIYTSVARPSCNHVSNYNDKKTLSESTLVDVPFHNAMVHNHRHPSDFCSTLPSYSSQTVYPTTESDCGTSHSLNRRYSSRDNSNNTLTSTGCYNSNSLNHFSSDQCSPCHDSDLVTSCAEMDSGSFYHVVPDDCVDRINSMKKNGDLTGNVKDRIDHSPNSTIRCLDLPYEEGHDKSYDDSLDIGSVVEIIIKGEPNYGVIKWIGTIPEYQNGQKKIAGIELEEENLGCTDGALNGRRLFECPPRKGFFVQLNKCLKDSRFTESDSILDRSSSAEFGSMDCPVVSGDVSPLSQPEDISTICGKYRGIQGHHNSCYLDATLFSMFSFTPVFDCILHRPYTKNDINQYTKVQQVLKEEIVNPLRRNLYVRADRVMKLRKLLDELSSVSGLTSEEKDPEEFLNSLLNQIMKAEPFLKLSSGQESYFYQLFVEKDEKIVLPTVQQLFDQSFLASDIKLKEVPSCLLIQMPRFGKQFKMYPRIIPSPYLDITDILEDSPRQCSICGQVAEFECKECYLQFGEGLESTAFCKKCLVKSHSHQKRSKHKSTKLNIPDNFQMLKDHTPIPRIFMELFAVVCIETSHYVAFVKCGTGPDAPWCFFDSMADRRGEQNGYNIPEVVPFKDLKWWLSEEGFNFLLSTKDDKNLPEMPKRLLCDAYMCFYQSPDVMMYR